MQAPHLTHFAGSICIEGSEGEDTEGLAASVAGEVIAEVLQIQGAS